MKVRYQPYAWNGTRYTVMSVPVYETEEEAIQAVHNMIADKQNTSIWRSIRLHWKERPVIAKRREYK